MSDDAPERPDETDPAPMSARADASTPWWVTAAVAVVVTAGVVARFLPRGSQWLDEALSANISQLPIGDIPSALRRDGHPPLYYVLLHAWGNVVGWTPWALRALSGIFGVAALPLAWWAGARVGGRPNGDGWIDPLRARRTATASLVLLAALPFAIRYSSETRMYSLIMLLVLCGFLLLDHHRERPRWSTAIGVAVVSHSPRPIQLVPRMISTRIIARRMVCCLWSHVSTFTLK